MQTSKSTKLPPKRILVCVSNRCLLSLNRPLYNQGGDRNLTADGVRAQLEASLKNLGRDSVDLFYLHAPDHHTPIEETLRAVNELHVEGKFKTFGLSNYAAWQVADIVGICQREGYVRPTVYQGMYNALTREVERELFPCLRHFGMAFYAYNVTAAGLLTGKHKSVDSLPDDGRFTVQRYQERFWKQEYFDALATIRDACDAANVSMVDAAHRWLMNHSKLTENDAVIVGGSRVAHIDSNTRACFGGKLDQSILDAIDKAYEVARKSAPCYFR